MNWKIIIIFLALILGVSGASFYIGQRVSTNLVPAPPPTPATATVEPTPTQGTEADESAVLAAAMKEQIVAEHGPEANTLTITVKTINGDYAQGAANQQEGGGGMWFAAKVNGMWKLVWDGNGVVGCKDVAPYPNFPTDMIPACYDTAKQDMVNR